MHPDQFYKPYTSTGAEEACHRGDGPAGHFGAETSDCDSPISLINSTFHWIDKHIKDSIDFIVWTGDSARHDNDEEIPRTEEEVVGLNKLLVNKFVEVFGKEDDDDDPTNDFIIPIVPTFGNNDILPHNIFRPGPNFWTKRYTSIWRKFIPEEQRHVFERGGYFFVEAIPRQLAVFSLNTLYFFDSNTAVDGCADSSEPGYEQMEWLRIQLQLLRERGMKAILTGHVPPARTENKLSWDETCWQKYTLWMHQYRDVVVGSVYGHMNIDHFMLQDSGEISQKAMDGICEITTRTALDDDFTVQSSAEYLSDLRTEWRRLPDSKGLDLDGASNKKSDQNPETMRKKKKKKSKEAKYFEKIGGEWGERYSLSLVSPSVVPNYFPTMRVIEYNITGLERMDTASTIKSTDFPGPSGQILLGTKVDVGILDPPFESQRKESSHKQSKKNKKSKKSSKGRKKHKPKKPKFTMPPPPSKSSPPGPAYSPQTFTWLSLTQYVANITTINNDFTPSEPKSFHGEPASSLSLAVDTASDDFLDEQRWHEGKHSGEKPKRKKAHKAFKYEVEYDTKTDPVFNLTDLTVRSYIDLASRMGHCKPHKDFLLDEDTVGKADHGIDDVEVNSIDEESLKGSKKKSKKDKKKEKRKRRKENEELWFTFVKRAYVGTRDDDELRDDFGNG